MNRTKILTWQRDRIPTWMLTVVMATAIALSLMWGVNPAAADTAPASTPTVAPVATLAPVATATPSSSGSFRTRAQAPLTGDQCASPDPNYASPCALEMVLVPAATPAGDAGWRVGDLIKVDIRVKNHSATSSFSFNGLSAHVDFVLSELQLVNASKTPVPVSTPSGGSTNVDGAIIDLTGSSLPNANSERQILKNYYSEVDTKGKIDFEAGVTDIANAVTVAANTGDVLIGSFYVRVKTNPGSDANYTLTLRAQNAVTDVSATDGARNSVIGDGSSVGTAGKNIMGQATSAVLTVKKTTVNQSLAVGTPVARSATRTGDTIPVALQLSNSANMFVRNATSIDAAVSFDTTKFTLVKADENGDDSKVSVAVDADNATVADITGATAHALASATFQTAGLKYTENGTTGTVTLKLDSATAIAFNGTAATKTVGTIYLRPRYNTAAQDVTIVAGSIIGIRAGQNMGFQLDVTATAATSPVTVTTTTVNLTMVPTLTSPIRVGDAIPVALKIAPTDARYVNRIETTIFFDATQFQLVQDGTTAYTPVTNGASVSLDGSALTAGGNNASAATNTFMISGNGTITLNVSGAFLTEGPSPVLVGTFYVRPLKKTASSHPINFSASIASRAGEKRSTNADPGLDFLIAVTPASNASDGTQLASPAIGPVLGTLGVSLKMRSPTVASPTLAADDIAWISSASTPATLNVVDGRFLDVLVQVDAADTVGDARKVDDFVIDVAFDNRQLSLGGATTLTSASCAGTGDDRAVVCKPATTVTGTVAGTATAATSTMRLTLQSSNMLTTPAEVARVRFRVLSPDDNSAAVALNVADTTILRQKTGANPANLFVTDNYANIRPSMNNGLGEFDLTSTATHQKPATLQVSTMLQGRTAGNDATRFVQNFGIELRKAVNDGGTAVTRHLTVTTTPASVRSCSTTCDPAMKFDKFSKKASSGPNAEFAASGTGGAAAEPLADLEPGTYDVYLKGRSSVAVLVTGVAFGPGNTKSITGLVLREGDIAADVDKVNLDDFTAWKANYNAVPSTDETKRSDFNQSGYVDILDFSLLASNFDGARAAGPYSVATGQDGGIGTVTVARLRPTTTSPHGSLTASVGTANDDGIVPVTLSLTPGSRPVEGAQVVLKTAPGVQIVDASGNAVDNDTAFVADDNTSLPTTLRQTIDAARGLLNLGLGSISRSVASDTTLGTLFLKITGTPAGAPISFLRTDGSFATLIAGSGDDLTGKLIVNANGQVIVDEVDAIIPAPAPSTPVTVSEPAAAAPARASAPSRAAAPAPAASAPVAAPMSPALSEDTARGIVSVAIPGREPVELKTGLATLVPDAYCPTVRHNTYIRLEDEGIAGATFGVEAGGVLSWVTPDQAGCVNWSAISEGGLTFTKETIMQFQLARAVPGALLWVLSGDRNGELYEVDPNGIATYITGENFAANQDHFRQVWANVIPVSTSQVDGLASRGAVSR